MKVVSGKLMLRNVPTTSTLLVLVGGWVTSDFCAYSRGGPPQFCQMTWGWATENQYLKKKIFIVHPPPPCTLWPVPYMAGKNCSSMASFVTRTLCWNCLGHEGFVFWIQQLRSSIKSWAILRFFCCVFLLEDKLSFFSNSFKLANLNLY